MSHVVQQSTYLIQIYENFPADNGALYSCGSNYYGCLGLEENEDYEEDDDIQSPTLIEPFINIKISQIACGECHVLALTGKSSLKY